MPKKSMFCLTNAFHCRILALAESYFAAKNKDMDIKKKQKQELVRLERAILKYVNYVDGKGITPSLSSCTPEKKAQLEEMLADAMFC